MTSGSVASAAASVRVQRFRADRGPHLDESAMKRARSRLVVVLDEGEGGGPSDRTRTNAGPIVVLAILAIKERRVRVILARSATALRPLWRPVRGRNPRAAFWSDLVGPSGRQHFVGPCPDVVIELGDLLVVEQLVPRLHLAVGAPGFHDRT